MIIETGFLDHWKTRLLEKLLNDPLGHTYIMRLWEHCVLRKCWQFPADAKMLAAICAYKSDENLLYDAMVKSGFIEEKKGGIYIHDWEKANAGLVSNWNKGTYGKLGGRPPKTLRDKKNNPEGSQKKPDRLDRLDKIDEIDNTEVVFRLEMQRPKSAQEVIDLFTFNSFIEAENAGQICFDHYESKDWKIDDRPFADWKARARSWYRQYYKPSNAKKDLTPEQKRREQIEAEYQEATKRQIG